MNDGNGESGTQKENYAKKRHGDEFARAVAKIAVAQVCEGVGFQGFQHSALEAFSDVAARYLYSLGKTAQFYANLAGRADSNVFDVIQGLEDLVGPTQGFSSASDVNHCLLGSGAVQEIQQYIHSAEEIPFVRPIPRFPIVKNRKPISSFAQLGEAPPDKHIPDWLPAFPEPLTYMRTPVWNEKNIDSKMDKTEQRKQRRKAESALLSLQQRLGCGGTAVHTSLDPSDAGEEKQVLEGNRFLAQPLQFWEKEVSPVTEPDMPSNEARTENKVSVLDKFAPVIKVAKSGRFDDGENESKILANKRPIVHFRFGGHEKSTAMPLAFSSEKTASWFERDDEKHDKKRRAEQILKEAMENPQQLALL